ncbi:MAG: type II toxin-antitoxin system VapC family toxin [Planctomycetaceae bacterium]|nr:type II toxin-antitoxin system VapC family toxin [Planctomycetaceae bacterium]
MLLDTCAFVWLAMGEAKLSKQVRQMIEIADAVFVSAISAFEIAHKYAAGGLELPIEPGQWFAQVVSKHNLTEIPITSEIAIAATKLPPLHKDPCDRFIIATAKLNRLPVITADRRFDDYGIETYC